MIGFNVQQLLNDADLGQLYEVYASKNVGMPRTVKGALDQVYYQTDVDPRDFVEAVVFANTIEVAQSEVAQSGSSQSIPYFGALLKGTFSPDRLIATIENKTNSKLDNSKYKGAKLYLYTQGPLARLCITFIGTQLILVGSDSAVKDTIDVMVGDKPPVNGAVVDLYGKLAPATFKLASSIPSLLNMLIPSTADIENSKLDLHYLRDVSLVGCTFGKIGSSVVIEVQMHCNYEASAAGIDELADNLIILFKKQSLPPGVLRLLDKVETAVYGPTFSLRISLTTSEIEDLMLSLMN